MISGVFKKIKAKNDGFEREIELSRLLCSLIWEGFKFHNMKHDMLSYCISKA